MAAVFAFSVIGEDAAGAIGGLVCGGSAALLIYGLPAMMLFRAASTARKFARNADAVSMTEMLSGQLRFWRTIGILAAIVMGIYGIGIMIVIGFGAMGFLM